MDKTETIQFVVMMIISMVTVFIVFKMAMTLIEDIENIPVDAPQAQPLASSTTTYVPAYNQSSTYNNITFNYLDDDYDLSLPDYDDGLSMYDNALSMYDITEDLSVTFDTI